RVTQAAAAIITNPCPARERLTAGLYEPRDTSGGVALVKRAFARTVAVQPIRDRMHAARVRDIDLALADGTINAEEAVQLRSAAIAVNVFSLEELASRGLPKHGDLSSQVKILSPAAE